jgi:NAD(P)-dependent dehydrogenase (short-subunit alcohol dehydrogenase family)
MKIFDFTGKVALMAGGAGYLSLPACKALANQGAAIAIADLSLERAQEAVRQLTGEFPGARLKALALDIHQDDSVRNVVEQTCREFGRIDIVVNATYATSVKRVEDISTAELDKTFHNLTGSFLLAREAADRMSEGGSIIFVSSMYGQVAPDPGIYHPPMVPNPIDYGTCKAGIIQMTKYLAVYWAKRGIRVNAISPGPFPHPGSQHQDPEFIQRLSRKVPMGRIGRPDEMAGAVVFLASSEASYITGQTLAIDGGWTAW